MKVESLPKGLRWNDQFADGVLGLNVARVPKKRNQIPGEGVYQNRSCFEDVRKNSGEFQ
jgi:hypothetical protein